MDVVMRAAFLSASERQYIIDGVRADVRADGRRCRHVRHFSLKTGVVSNTSGSAMVERVRVQRSCGYCRNETVLT